MFSKACEYGIRAVIYISHQSENGERVSLKEVAKAIDSPVAFTAKILQALAREEVIVSTQGKTGGYEISDERQAEITLLHIVSAIDGDAIYKRCGLGLKECSDSMPCPMHYQFVAIRDELRTMLSTTTVRELSDGMQKGLSFLKR